MFSKSKNRKTASMITFILCLVLVVGVMDSFAGNGTVQTQEASSQSTITNEAIKEDLETDNESESKDKTVIEPEDKQEPKQEPKIKTQAKTKAGNISTQSGEELYDMTATWGTNGPTMTAIDDGKTKNLFINIDGTGKDKPDTNHKLVISYDHVDTSEYIEEKGETGIQVVDFDKPNSNDAGNPLNGIVTDVKNDTKNRQLIYTFNDQKFIQVGINISFVANQNKAYLGEKLDIETEFYKDDALVSETLYSQAEANMNIGYIYINSGITNPTQLSSGKGNGQIRFFGYKGGGSLDTHGKNATFVYDFSNVQVTANGDTKTYLEWLKEYKDSGKEIPFLLKKTDNSQLDSNYEGYNTTYTTTSTNLQNSSHEYLNYSKTDEFIANGNVAPRVNFRSMNQIKVSFFQNSRGPEREMVFTDSAVNAENLVKEGKFAFYNSTSTYTASANSDSVAYNIAPIVAGGAPYLQPDSVKYKDKSLDEYGFLYYQPLFKIGATSPRTEETAEGKENTIKVTIPEGVNVTHIKVPKIDSTNQYESIYYKGVKQEPGSYIEVSESNTREIELVVKGLVRLNSNQSNVQDMITFWGTTENLQPDESLKFGVIGTGEDKVKSITTKILNDKGINYSPYITKSTFIGEKDAKGNIKAISKTNPTKGTSIYMGMSIQTHAYAYGSAWFADPLKITTSDIEPISPNPVTYYNVPPGFDIGDVEITGNKNSSINGKELTPYVKVFEGEGKWGDQGGKLVEVKLAGPNGEDVYVINKYTYVNLELKIPLDYDSGSVTFKSEDMGFNTWYENAKTMSAGGNGTMYDIDMPDSALATIPDKYIGARDGNQDIDPTIPVGASIQGSVRMSDGKTYAPYSSSKPESVPVRPAGSDNEEFKLNVIYNLEKKVENGRVYFLMPQNDSWRPSLNKMPKVSTNVNDADYTIYYTKEDARNQTMDNDGDINVSWTKLINTTSDSELALIKGFKVEFNELTLGKNFTMLMPYEIPKLTGDVDWESEAQTKAIGQTQYNLGESGIEKDAATAALKLSKSDEPMIKAVTAADKEADMPGATQSFKYKDSSATLPSWYKVITYDDLTANVRLDSVKVDYVKQGSSDTTTTTFGIGKINTTTYQPASKGAIEYRSGYINEIDFGSGSAEDYLSLDKPGEYKITYTTTEDDDRHVSTFTRTIKVEKGGLDTINLSSKPVSMFYDQDLNDVGSTSTWDELLRSKLTVTDDGISIDPQSSQIKLRSIKDTTNSNEVIPSADIEKLVSDYGPGKYEITYTYDDGYGSVPMIKLTFTVKYRCTMTVNVWSPSITKNISDAAVSLSSGASVKTNSSGIVTFDIEATDTDPVHANYSLELKSVPNGYVIPATKVLTGSKNQNNVAIPVIFSAAPVSINANFEGNDLAHIVKNVSLYTKTGAKVAGPIDAKDLSSYKFDPKDISGDILNGKYYMQLELNNGYVPSTDSDFKVKSASDDSILVTSDLDIENSHIEKAAKFEESSHDIVFNAGSNGSLNAEGDKKITISSIAHREKWSQATEGKIPTPVSDTNYYFDGWNVSFPSLDDKIKTDLEFTATFKEKKDITLSAIEAGKTTYNGSEQSTEVTVELKGTLVPGHSYKDTLKATAKGTDAKVYETTIPAVTKDDFIGLDGKNPEYYYNINYTKSSFEIEKRKLSVKPKDETKVYDGNSLTPSYVSFVGGATSLGATDTFDLDNTTFSGTLTNTGATESAVTKLVIKGGSPVKDRTENYDVTYIKGNLTVTNATDLSVSGDDTSVTYDDKEYGIKGVKANKVGAKLLYSTTGALSSYSEDIPKFKEAGSHSVYVMAKLANHDDSAPIEKTVTISRRPVTVKPVDQKREYDGTPLNATALELTSNSPNKLVQSHKLNTNSGSYSGSQIIVGKSYSSISAGNIKINDGNDDKTENYLISSTDGTLTIDPNTTDLKVAAKDNTGKYDGNKYGINDPKALLKGSVDNSATLMYSTSLNGKYTKNMPTFEKAGTHKTYVKAVKANYKDSASVSANVIISKRSITIKPVDVNDTYKDKEITPKKEVEIISGSLVSGQKIDLSSAKFTGSMSKAGKTPIKVTGVKISGNNISNYDITYKQGTMTVDEDNSGGGGNTGGGTTTPDNPGENINTPAPNNNTPPTGTNVNFRQTGDTQASNGIEEGVGDGTESKTKTASQVPTLGIGENGIPLYGSQGGSWSLSNLLLAMTGLILAAMISIMATIKRMRERSLRLDMDEEMDEKPKNYSSLFLMGTIALALVGLLTFTFTQDMGLQMVLFDYFSPVNCLVLAAEIACAVLFFRQNGSLNDYIFKA